MFTQNAIEPAVAKKGPTQMWAEAFEFWLASHSENTQRAYRMSWEDFLVYSNKMPWQIGRSDVAAFKEELSRRGLSPASKNQRLAALSSFFKYVCTEYTLVDDAGVEVPLHKINPAAGKSLRSKVELYGKANALTIDQVQALRSQIPRDTVLGLRDYAMITAYLYTARRNTEIRRLRWGDIEKNGETIWYVWSGKRKTDQRCEMPRPVYDAIITFLSAAGMLETIQADDYIFVTVASGNRKEGQPLCMREVGRMLKKYLRLAGLDAEEIHVHTLRHTAAMLRRWAGESIEDISALLGHSTIATTQIYLDKVEGKPDTGWSKVSTLLGE